MFWQNFQNPCVFPDRDLFYYTVQIGRGQYICLCWYGQPIRALSRLGGGGGGGGGMKSSFVVLVYLRDNSSLQSSFQNAAMLWFSAVGSTLLGTSTLDHNGLMR